MTVKCLAISLNEEQRTKLAISPYLQPAFGLTVGAVYTVLGISFVKSGVYGSISLFDIQDDNERCISVPMCLFSIVDPRPSKYWIARASNEFNLTLWPEQFYADYFHDRLSEYIPEYVTTFKKTFQLLEEEFL